MTVAALAGRIADCEAARTRARRQLLFLAPVLALTGALLGLLLFGSVRNAAALAVVGATFGAASAVVVLVSTRRRLARLEADQPALFAEALERYRMVSATERASRYKLFC
ncbi:hypothetical protein [Rhodobacter sp. NSM]|uniref:hypothetical protein n=1 Tax=Rhodobacter sp. NSM TaxID=3457501 RepID=UPI003FD02BA2